MKTCLHTTVTVEWNGDQVFKRRCYECKDLQPLGRSNDRDPNVRIELVAAELGQDRLVFERWDDRDAQITADLKRIKVALRSLERGVFAHHEDDQPSETDGSLSYWAGWLAGWLAWEMLCETYDPKRWPWDASRPLAGQFEEWVARTDRNIAAMEDDAVANLLEQVTPHDPPIEKPIDGLMNQPWTSSDREAFDRPFNAAAYEADRAADPDTRDDDDDDSHDHDAAAHAEAVEDALLDRVDGGR